MLDWPIIRRQCPSNQLRLQLSQMSVVGTVAIAREFGVGLFIILPCLGSAGCVSLEVDVVLWLGEL